MPIYINYNINNISSCCLESYVNVFFFIKVNVFHDELFLLTYG